MVTLNQGSQPSLENPTETTPENKHPNFTLLPNFLNKSNQKPEGKKGW